MVNCPNYFQSYSFYQLNLLAKFEIPWTFPSYYPGWVGGGWGCGGVVKIRYKTISVQLVDIEVGWTGTELGNTV